MTDMIPYRVALRQLLDEARAVERTETVPTLYGEGRVLAEDIVSPVNVPSADNSQMDGYAVRSADLAAATPENPVRLQISQRIPAGAVGTELEPGTAARIFTGAPVPPGADAVVQQEIVRIAEDGSAEFASPVKPGKFVRRAGGDFAAGEAVLKKGERLTPAKLGLAAAAGRAYVKVFGRIRVSMFCSGNELVKPGEPLREGAIYNSNRYQLRGLLHALGCEVTDVGSVQDTLEDTVEAFKKAARASDVIITTGGMSVGEEDHIKPAVRQLGTIDMWRLAVKPGKPFAHGEVLGVPFLGLPGNPVAVFVETLMLVRPFLRVLQGGMPELLTPISVRADFAWKAGDREEFIRVFRNQNGGLSLLPNQNSQILSSCARADGIVDVPLGKDIREGDTVDYYPLAEFLA